MNVYDEVCPRCGSMMNRSELCGMCDYTFPFVEEKESAEGTETDSGEWDNDDDWRDHEPDCLGGEG